MQPQTKSIIDAAAALPEAERLLIVEHLLETLPPESPGLTEEEFVAELNRRDADFDNGTSGAITWSELRTQE